jgi:predicted transcriptional regulator
MFDNVRRSLVVDIDILEYYIGNVYTCRNTKYCDLEAYMELLMQSRGHHICRSVRELADRWKWSQGRVRRFLNFLVRANMIKIEKTPIRGSFYIYVFEPEGSDE